LSTDFDIRKIKEGLDEESLYFTPFIMGGKFHYEPSEEMKIVHERLYQAIRSVASSNLIFAINGSMGCHTYFNVWQHMYWGKREHFYLLDLHNAYSQIKTADLVSVFCDLLPSCSSRKTEKIFKCYFIDDQGGLLRGAPASPDLFNMALKSLDETLLKLCEKYGLEYTRYMDDICISSYAYIGPSVRREIRQVIDEFGFGLNHQKSKVLELKKGPIKITGLWLDANGRITIPNKFKRNLKAVLYGVLNGDESISREMVEGRWGYFSYIHLRMGENQRLTRDDREIIRMFREYRRMLGKPLPKILLPPKKYVKKTYTVKNNLKGMPVFSMD